MRSFTPRPAPAARFTDPPRPACEGIEDDGLWFPHESDAAQAADLAERIYCGTCHAREACLAQALADDVEGVWAGTTHRQRKATRRKAGRVAQSLATGAVAGVRRR